MSDALPAIAALLADELRRARCRTADHTKDRCKRCEALAAYDAHVRIVQTPAVAAEQARAALRQVADRTGERHD